MGVGDAGASGDDSRMAQGHMEMRPKYRQRPADALNWPPMNACHPDRRIDETGVVTPANLRCRAAPPAQQKSVALRPRAFGL